MTRFSVAAAQQGLCRPRTSCAWGDVPHTSQGAAEARAAADAAFEPLPDERSLTAAAVAAADVQTLAESVRLDMADTARFLDAWQHDPGRPQRQPGQRDCIAVCDGRQYG